MKNSMRFIVLVLLGALATPALAHDAAPGACPAAAAACCESSAAACCAAPVAKTQFQVSGLAGSECASKVQAALAKLEGVSEASACAESKTVSVSFDAAKVKEKKLVAAIRKAGFKVDSETVDLRVDGMTGAACSAKLDSALAKLKGVSEQKVCHEAKNAVVTFDPAKLSREKVVAAIAKAGFTVIN
jgi:Cu+-exporting ATPase